MKKIGFLSFGHWTPSPHSEVRTASDALLQSIELAVAAEELGADGAFFRVHHYARQLGSPFPLLAAVGARTKRIEIGTAVIDMRYENPLYMAEDAGAADIVGGGRLQLGISRGSPEQVIDGWRYFGYAPAEGQSDADMARRHTEVFLEVLRGQGFATRMRQSEICLKWNRPRTTKAFRAITCRLPFPRSRPAFPSSANSCPTPHLTRAGRCTRRDWGKISDSTRTRIPTTEDWRGTRNVRYG